MLLSTSLRSRASIASFRRSKVEPEHAYRKGRAVTFRNTIFSLFFPNDINNFDGFKAIVKQHILESCETLDLGCGDNSVLASYRCPDRQVWGTDFAVHPRLQDAEWFRLLGGNGKIPFTDGTFDLVVCISVMEHVADGRAFFDEVARVLKPSGFFIGHSVSGDHYVTWIRRAFGLLPHSINQLIVKTLYGRDEVDTFPALYRLNRESAIDEAAQLAGLRRIDLLRYADQGYFSFCRPLLPVAATVDGVLAQFSSAWGRLYFTVILEKSLRAQQTELDRSKEPPRGP
jgi:SAM-dependent methyltransferase